MHKAVARNNHSLSTEEAEPSLLHVLVEDLISINIVRTIIDSPFSEAFFVFVASTLNELLRNDTESTAKDPSGRPYKLSVAGAEWTYIVRLRVHPLPFTTRSQNVSTRT